MAKNEAKKKIFLQMLHLGQTMLHLDPRCAGVDVPAKFRDFTFLQLNYSYRFNLTVFEINSKEVKAKLRFSGEEYLCVVPWEAVYGIYSHVTEELGIWREDVPSELREAVEAELRFVN